MITCESVKELNVVQHFIIRPVIYTEIELHEPDFTYVTVCSVEETKTLGNNCVF